MFQTHALPPDIQPRVLHYREVTSTMDVAAELLKAERAGGAPVAHLTAVVADVQTNGRGRQGKTWATHPGESLAVTFILKNTQAEHLPLLMALAVRRALISLGGAGGQAEDILLKWPNDIITPKPAAKTHTPPTGHHAEFGKLGGILIEKTEGCALFGLGVNISGRQKPPPAQTLEELGIITTREAILSALFPCISATLALYASQGWRVFQEEYIRYCWTLGKKVVWHRSENEKFQGVALGLHPSGALQLRLEDATVHLIHSGDVVAQGAASLPS